MSKWVASKWEKASGGGGTPGVTLENAETGERGYGKLGSMWQELLGSWLAQEVGVGVPPAEPGEYDGKTIPISKAWGSKSMDVLTARAAGSENDAGLKAGLANATGALGYHAWVGTQDLKDQHVLVRAAAPGVFECACIDFADAFNQPTLDSNVLIKDEHRSIIDNRDPAILETTIKRIENLSRERIQEVVSQVPDEMMAPALKAATVASLDTRKGRLRE